MILKLIKCLWYALLRSKVRQNKSNPFFHVFNHAEAGHSTQLHLILILILMLMEKKIVLLVFSQWQTVSGKGKRENFLGWKWNRWFTSLHHQVKHPTGDPFHDLLLQSAQIVYRWCFIGVLSNFHDLITRNSHYKMVAEEYECHDVL